MQAVGLSLAWRYVVCLSAAVDGVFEEGGEEEETDELVGQVRRRGSIMLPRPGPSLCAHAASQPSWQLICAEKGRCSFSGLGAAVTRSAGCSLAAHSSSDPFTQPLPAQVLDEIGINLDSALVSAPGQRVAAAAPAAAAAVPMAQPMGAGEAAGAVPPLCVRQARVCCSRQYGAAGQASRH